MKCAPKDHRLEVRQSTTACYSIGYVDYADGSEQREDQFFTATGQG